jgi:nitrogen fixation protein NifU and related proteins
VRDDRAPASATQGAPVPGLEDLYREIILDHYRSPRNRGELPSPPAHKTEGFNPLCGDEVVLYVDVDPDTGAVRDIRTAGQGCSISQASTSVMTDLVVGRSVKEAMTTQAAFSELMQGRGQIEPDEDVLEDGIAFAGVAKYPARVKCALLGWMAFKDALAQSGAQWDSEEKR